MFGKKTLYIISPPRATKKQLQEMDKQLKKSNDNVVVLLPQTLVAR